MEERQFAAVMVAVLLAIFLIALGCGFLLGSHLAALS